MAERDPTVGRLCAVRCGLWWLSLMACSWLAPAPPATVGDPGVRLLPVADGFDQPVELRFEPGRPETLWVAEKTGKLRWFDLRSRQTGTVAQVAVRTVSEMGLLGFAFDPAFDENGRLYLSYNPADGAPRSRIEAWRVDPRRPSDGAVAERVLLEVAQPFANHDGGQIQFGPDGMLYVSFGDGGSAGDPQGNGQGVDTLLGKILRLDPAGTPYAVPADNPKGPWRPEVFVAGVRNPWKSAFAPDGTLVVADVGQDRLEEISVARAGDNLGWKVREADLCFEPMEGCITQGFVDPFYVYDHDDGRSITGGYVYGGASIPSLRGRYVFADFVSGWIRAVSLPPAKPSPLDLLPPGSGTWSTFGVDAAGEIYVADFGRGAVFRLASSE